MTTPLSLLVPGEDIDSRVTGRRTGIKELAASIAAHGLLQPLNVRAIEDGKRFQVIDGNRRLLALQSLAKSKKLKKDEPIDTVVTTKDDAAAREASLAANIVRLELDPVDMYEQFAALAENEAPGEIAARFGVTEKLVRQRLALGKLAPEIREALRKGKIKLEHAQAFTINEDQAAQLAAFKSIRFGSWTNADSVKRSLEQDTIDAKAGIVKFVGLEAYAAAGGEIVESLFDKDTYVKDSGLIHRLAREKLEAEAERLRADGWSFAIVDAEGSEVGSYDEVDVVDYFTADEKAEFDKEPHEWTPKAKKIEATVKERMRADPTVRAISGCAVSYNDHSGAIQVEYAVKKFDPSAEGEDDDTEQQEGDDGDAGEGTDANDEIVQAPPRVSNLERERLSRTLSDAIRRSFPNSLTVAVCAAIATLEIIGPSPLSIEKRLHSRLAEPEDDDADEKEWRDIFNEAMEMTGEGQMRRLATALGATVRVGLPSMYSVRHHDQDDISALIEAINPEVFCAAMQEVFGAREYFSRGTSKMALEALSDMGVKPPANRSKANVIEAAIEAATAQGYLPPELRTVHYTGPRAAGLREAAE